MEQLPEQQNQVFQYLKTLLIQKREKLCADKRSGVALCRRVNLETVAAINRNYNLSMSGISALPLIDRFFPDLKGNSSGLGEHVIGVINFNEQFYIAFDGTADQVVGATQEIVFWQAETYEELLEKISSTIGGQWRLGC